MFPSSLAVVLTGLLIGGIALAAFYWGWRRGYFRELDAQSRVIFDDRDYRLARPWETAEQRADRELRHGTPEPPGPGEWGGAA
jgi:cbb3-type cytochrome oxidase maturation protein